MFEDYTISQQISFANKVENVCISKSDIIMASGRKTATISHLNGCDQQIDLFKYFREEMNLALNFCLGVQEIATQSKNHGCFGVILDSQLWCLIVSITKKQSNQNHLQIEQLKLLTFNESQSVANIRFVNGCTPQMLILRSKDSCLTQIIPDLNHIDKFIVNKYKNLKFHKENQQPQDYEKDFTKSNQIFDIYHDYVFVYNQVKQLTNWRNHVFFYSMIQQQKQELQDEHTFPQHIVTLPLYEDERILSYVSFVPRNENKKVESSFILAIYQLPAGIEIIECLFQNSNVVNRKVSYSGIFFQSMISSSLNDQMIHIKGIQHCLQHHTMMIGASSGIGLNYKIILVSLPSTGTSLLINSFELPSLALFIRQNQKSLWILSGNKLIELQKISKMQIYNKWIENLQQQGRLGLSQLRGELSHILE